MRVPLPLTILAGIALAACAAGSPTAAPTTAPTTAATSAASGSPAAGTPAGQAITCGASGSGAAASMANLAFSPGSVTVASGGFVTWTNNDNTTHTVTFDNGPDCGRVNGGGSKLTVQFNAPGTYAYHCTIHPSMKAAVTVSG